jgi:hypothetical protein
MTSRLMTLKTFPLRAAAGLLVAAAQLSCTQPAPSTQPSSSSGWFKPKASPVQVERVRLGLAAAEKVDAAGGLALTSARNEWIDLTLRVSGLSAKQLKAASIRMTPMKQTGGSAVLAPANVRWYEVADVPVSAAGPETLRHLGSTNVPPQLPRALLPLGDGTGKLARAKSAAPLLWADVFVPGETPAGVYEGTCDVLDGKRVLAKLPVTLTVRDFVLPPERNLVITGRMGWDALRAQYPGQFEGLTKWLISRDDPRTAPAVGVLDALMKACQRNRVQAWFPDLQPIAKWPVGKPPELEWGDFDGILRPWMTGDGFDVRTPLAYWPVPAVDSFDRFDPASQVAYWREAATHFDQMGWARRTSILTGTGKAPLDSLLRVPRVRLTVPVHGASPLPADASRVQTLGDGLVSTEGTRPAEGAPAWLMTEDPGAAPYTGGAADERDVRVWGWLANMDQAGLVVWQRAIAGGEPDARQPGAVWLYPGSMFGRTEPVETVWLKWLRRAEQDYEYLRLARLRGDARAADAIARLVAKPVKVPRERGNDTAVYTMMAGTADAHTFDEARDLIARLILLREPGQAVNENRQQELELETIRWTANQQRPRVVPRLTHWTWDAQTPGRLSLGLVMDLYNGSDQSPTNSALQWTLLPPGWEVRPQPFPIPELPPYHVTPAEMIGRFDATALRLTASTPATVTFVNGFDQSASSVALAVPVASCDRRAASLTIDGSLGDWSEADAAFDGKLVEMLNRPIVQRQTLERSTNDCTVYSSWSPDQLYIAFKIAGVSPDALRTLRNFVDYQAGRAWGEDLCEMVVQAVYPDNTAGATVHLVCKPGGQWVERKRDGRWEPIESASVRYASTLDADVWRGEVAVPWRVLTDNAGRVPSFLRFNFSQHQKSSGRSSSWAGPVDSGRDDGFTGVLVVREQPGEVVGK